MESKQLYDHIADYAKQTIRRIEWDIDFMEGGIFGGVSYNVKDLINIYKIKRMKDMNYITEEQYYKLIDLVHNFLKLNDVLDVLQSNESYHDEELEDNLYNKIVSLEEELNYYNISVESTTIEDLIDSDVKLLLHPKNSK